MELQRAMGGDSNDCENLKMVVSRSSIVVNEPTYKANHAYIRASAKPVAIESEESAHVSPRSHYEMRVEHPLIEGELERDKDKYKRLIEMKLVCQGPILHIATLTVKAASHLMTKLQCAGFKHTMTRFVTPARTILSCESTTNISILLWLENMFGNAWLIDISNRTVCNSVASFVTTTLKDSRDLFFERVRCVINDRNAY